MIRFKLDEKTTFSMTRLDLMSSLESLKSLLAKVKSNHPDFYRNVGICANWKSAFSYPLVSYFGSHWPKSAHPGKWHPHPIVSNGTRLWEGINKELRIDLMEFIINELEQLIKNPHELGDSKTMKHNPDNVSVSLTVPDYGTICFSLTEIYRIQSAAKTLLKNALNGKIKGSSSTGICYKLYHLADLTNSTDIIRLVGHIATRWPHSASPGRYSVYPVPKSLEHDSWWEGEALEYRIDLLKYIIKRLKDTIRRAEKNGKAIIQ